MSKSFFNNDLCYVEPAEPILFEAGLKPVWRLSNIPLSKAADVIGEVKRKGYAISDPCGVYRFDRRGLVSFSFGPQLHCCSLKKAYRFDATILPPRPQKPTRSKKIAAHAPAARGQIAEWENFLAIPHAAFRHTRNCPIYPTRQRTCCGLISTHSVPRIFS